MARVTGRPAASVDSALANHSRGLAAAILLSALILVVWSALTPSLAAAAGQCTPQEPRYGVGPPPRDVCIADKLFRARGQIQARCLRDPALPGERYPAPNWCRGGREQIEAIAHARFISRVGYDPQGIDPAVQWEVQLPPGRERADLTYDHNGTVELYEVKRTANDDYPRTMTQLSGYQARLQARGVATTLGPRDYFDYFLIGRPEKCTTPGGQLVSANRLFLSWRITSGVIAVVEAPFVCFDAARERVPVPVMQPVRLPGSTQEVDVPVDRMGDSVFPQPAPGTSFDLLTPVLPPPALASAPDSTPPGGSSGATGGDPHLTSLDGLGFDFQAAGEFQVVEADGVNIQARLGKRGSSVSVVDRIAFELSDHVAEIEPLSAKLWIDGQPVALTGGNMFDFGDGAILARNGNAYRATWPGAGVRPSLQASGGFISYYVPPDRHPAGLLGDSDGRPDNDLMLVDGTRLPATSSASAIHGAFADSWRITDQESLFTYAPGESTSTFTDRAFPETVISIGDYPDEVLADATAHCTDAGVADGRPFENCLLDWAVTREQSFVQAAAEHDMPSVEPGARNVDVGGVVTESFDTTVAPNFSSPRYGSGAGTGKFAGPFGRDGRYSASVGILPGHESVTVQLDLITLGTWPGGASEPVTVTINGTTAWSGDVTSRAPTAEGTTPAGQPYAVYPLSVKVAHSDEQLNVGVSARLPLGVTRAFGVDNLRASLELVAPEAFDVSLPLQAPRTSLPGSGELETTGSEDEYRFSMPSAGEVQVDLASCVPGVSWTLMRVTDRQTVASGVCGSKRTPALSAGGYGLSLTSHGQVGTYKMSVVKVPDPQRFAVTLPVVAANDVPGDGAGRLETTASEDDYEFSTQATSGIIIDLAGCSGALDTLTWRLVDAVSGIAHASSRSCSSTLVPNLQAGRFRLEVTSNGKVGTYSASLDLQPAPQVFDVNLPASIQDSAPAGAGNLETNASEDVYAFETTAAGGLVIDLSSCSPSLSAVNWRLSSEAGATIGSESSTCGGAFVANVPAGRYRLSVSRRGSKGTYKLQVSPQPPPQEFNVNLPATVQDGSPAGAGNLETSASEDVYSFTTTAAGSLQIDVSSCSPALGRVAWKLSSEAGTTIKASDAYGTCRGQLVPDMPAGRYKLSVKGPAGVNSPGTYRLEVLSSPGAQTFQITPPASISNGSPGAGAGNLETTASEDRYQFTTTATTTVQLNFSDCETSLRSEYGSWSLVVASSGVSVASGGWDCESWEARDVPAGTYQVRVTRNHAKGTYKLRLLAQAPQRFNVSLPASISEGSPAAGAGTLETTASEDIYSFDTSAPGGLQIDVSNCSSALTGVEWRLLDDAGAVVSAGDPYSTCSGTLVPDLPAGHYVLRVLPPHQRTGTYALSVFSQPSPQSFHVTLPAAISDGSPAAGAGNLETTASEDRYGFTTTATAMVQMTFSECAGSLSDFGSGSWKLVRVSTGTTVSSGWWDCQSASAPAVPDVSAGAYELRVSRNAVKGTYKLQLLGEAPQRFDVSLPASISDGTPAAGAGNLETTASQDVYDFDTSTAGGLVIDLSSCSTSSSSVVWTLVSESGGVQASSPSYGTCAGTLVPNVPAGRYRLAVSRPGQTGTYRLELLAPPPPQTFQVTLPATISDGSPAAGAGNLETSASEDRYEFKTTATGNVQMSFSDCAASLQGSVSFKLIRASTGATVSSGSWGCGDQSARNLPAGTYELRVSRSGAKGTYKLGLVAAAPQRFSVSLPASISDGLPAAGTGNLETSASEDVYAFDTSAAGGLEINASNCSASLSDVSWRLVDEDGSLKYSMDGTCSSKLVPNLPAGRYSLSVSRPGRTGTYQLRVISQAPQSFQVLLPASISDGTPAAGAGNLETTASEDRYHFTTTAAGTLYLGFSECSVSLSSIEWRLYDGAGNGISRSPSATCGGWYLNDQPAGHYTLAVAGAGRTGTYKLGIVSAAPQAFQVSLPASISDGVPAAGAGNLETPASQDRYSFTTTATGKVRLGFSECSTTLGTVVWQLVNSGGYAISTPSQYACGTWTISNVPADTYQLRVFHYGAAGTYKLQVQAASPQQFDVSLPASIGNGSPAPGAGNLETAVSEDVYAFDTNATDRLKLAFSECSSASGVDWKLVDSAGTTVRSLSGNCASTIVPDVPAGQYKLKVTGSTGTYKLQVLVPIAPQVFNVTLPISISNGVPGPGAGNIETPDSEDRYRFTTTATSTVQLNFSECAGLPLLGAVTWTLVNTQTGALVAASGAAAACGSTTVGVPAGTYQVRVSQVGPISVLQALAGSLPRTYRLGLAAS